MNVIHEDLYQLKRWVNSNVISHTVKRWANESLPSLHPFLLVSEKKVPPAGAWMDR